MIEAKNLSKSFDNIKALDNINASIRDGDVFGLIGTNGAGKSTFLKVLAGILKPDSGEILIDDENVFEKSYLKTKKRSFFEIFSLRHLKFYFILIALAAIAAAFLYSTYSMDQNNVKNDSVLNNKIENFMDKK